MAKLTKRATQILSHISALAFLLRDADEDSLLQAKERSEEFIDKYMVKGQEDTLPCSGVHADRDGALCDVDVFNAILEVICERLEFLD